MRVAILRTPSPATSVSNTLIDFFPSGTVSFATSVAVNFLRISAPAQITEGGYIQRRRGLNFQRRVYTMSTTSRYKDDIRRNQSTQA